MIPDDALELTASIFMLMGVTGYCYAVFVLMFAP